MTSEDEMDPISEEENREKEKEGKKGSGAGAIGRSKGVPSAAFFELMSRLGATMDQIARILREWTNLTPEAMNQRLEDFSKETARASANVQVEFDKKRNFAILHNFVSFFRRKRAPGMKHGYEEKPGPK